MSKSEKENFKNQFKGYKRVTKNSRGLWVGSLV